MPNTAACETLDAMCKVCGIHRSMWSGVDGHGDRHYTLDACEDSGGRLIVHSYDLTEAVYELSVLVGVEWED